MWHQKQKNETFPDRVMGPFSPQGPPDGNSTAPAPFDVSDKDFLSEPSRKRKSMVMNFPANTMSVATSQPVLRSTQLNESNHQHKSDVLSSMHEQGNITRGFSSPTPSFESDKTFQPVKYQEQTYSLTPQVNKQTIPVAVADKMDNFHPSTQQEAFHQKGIADMMKLLAGKIPNLSDIQSKLGNFFSQLEGHKHPYHEQTGTSMENPLSNRGSMGLNLGNRNHVLNVNLSSNMCAEAPKLLGSSAPSLNNRVSDHDHERIHSKDSLKTESSFEMNLNEHASYVGRAIGISTVGTSSLETAHCEGNVVERSFQCYNTEVISSTPRSNGVNPDQKHRDGNYRNNDTQLVESKGPVMQNGNYSTGECNADTSTYDLTGNEPGQCDDSQSVARTLDGKNKSHADNATSNTEKLWEGSIQLSTSFTTFAVAFFKSGEKAPEVAWPKSVVVKGKVRLEAFERFIQELPRARSRGLMVISLRWKVGSSKSGLEGMKQVAKGYKTGNKVGYAQISKAVDLYVCPRSDTIITILAKYGFFKGMAALEEDQDSLIGCVVWRRNPSSSDSTPKKSKNRTAPSSEQSLSSAPSSATSLNESVNTPVTHPAERVSPLDSAATGGISERSGAEVQAEAVLPKNNHTSSEAQKPQGEIPRPAPQDFTRENRQVAAAADDNDDLPEFDFGAACGIVGITSGKFSDAPAERANKNTSGHVASTMPAVQPRGIASQQRSHTTTLPIVSHGNQPSNPGKEFEKGESFGPVMPSSDGKAKAHDSELTVTTSTRKNRWDDDEDMPEWCPPDMEQQSRPARVPSAPCVPSPVPSPKQDNKLPGPPPPPPPPRPPVEAAATRPPNTFIPVSVPPVPNWKRENLNPGPPPRPSPLPGPPPVRATSRPSFSYIASPVPTRNPENTLPGPPPRPRLPPPPPMSNHPQPHRPVGVQPPMGQCPSMGFTYISAPRPQVNSYDIRPPVRPPPGWRGWQN